MIASTPCNVASDCPFTPLTLFTPTSLFLSLQGLWRDAERRRSEQESLLQTCTIQHITTVVDMAARYDLLE